MTPTRSRTTIRAIALPLLSLAVVGLMASTAAGDSNQALPADTGTVKSEIKIKKTRLTDLQVTTPGPLDGAEAEVTMTSVSGIKDGVPYASTLASLKLKNVAKAAEGTTYGVHLHVGPCVRGDGAAALAHYNNDVATGAPTVQVGPRTEIWLDATITDKGEAESWTTIKWIPQPGIRSIVFHSDHTADTGAAGPRLACIPAII